MNLYRRLRVPFTLVCALALALVLAASASAEQRAGDTTSPVDETISGQADLLSASAHYDSDTGAVSFTYTTREPTGGELEWEAVAELGMPVGGSCLSGELNGEEVENPRVQLSALYGDPYPENAQWTSVNGQEEPESYGRARLAQDGATSTLTASSPELANQPYVCAIVAMVKLGPMGEQVSTEDEVGFALHVVPATAPPASSTPPAVVTPAPKPGMLSFGATKPLSLKVGKWSKVKVKLANTGGTAIWPVTVKAKAPAGVMIKPGSGKQTLPALLGGQSWTVGFSVKLTANAKPKSTISFTGSSPGIAGVSGSVVLKSAGG